MSLTFEVLGILKIWKRHVKELKKLNQTDYSTFSIYTFLMEKTRFFQFFRQFFHNNMIFFYKFWKYEYSRWKSSKNPIDAILEFLDNLYDSLNNNQHHLAIYLDFYKAFDTISHEILMGKLFHMGFRRDLRGDIYSWHKNHT